MAWYSDMTKMAAGPLVRETDLDPSPRDLAAPAKPLDAEGDEDRRPASMTVAPSPRHDAHPRKDGEGIYAAFDVSQPVEEPHDLHGREQEVSALFSGVLRRRNHGIIAGPRGSGKTSLVRVFGQHADSEGAVVLYSACDDGTSFGVMLRSYLEQIPPAMVEAGMIETFEQRVLSFGADSSPYQATVVLAMLRYSQLVIVLDEFDRVTDPAMHDKVSSLLKLVSDARLPVRFVLVGGMSSFAHIVQAHPSLMRHVTIVSMAPLSEEAAGDLLDGCAKRCDMVIAPRAKELINSIACGSPFHVRLFGMHAALAAEAVGAQQVEYEHVMAGLETAFDEWQALNPTDAMAFRALMRGEYGSPAALIDLASRAARFTGTPASHGRGELQGELHAEDERALAALSDTVQRIHGHIVFRDATAPQFLLALQRLAQAEPTQIKGGKNRA